MARLVGIVGTIGCLRSPLRPPFGLVQEVFGEGVLLLKGVIAYAAGLDHAAEVGRLGGCAAVEGPNRAVASVWRTGESEPLITGHGAGDEVGLEGDVEARGVFGKRGG